MPIHDWTRVEAGVFHGFHVAWIGELRKALNSGLLPSKYYADAEQYAPQKQADVLTLHQSDPDFESLSEPYGGGVTTLPSIRTASHRAALVDQKPQTKMRRVAVRHVSGHRPIAFLELVSPGNLKGSDNRSEFCQKAWDCLATGIHVTVVELFSPRAGRKSLTETIWKKYDRKPLDPPAGKPLNLAAFVSKRRPEGYFEPVGLGEELPAFPLFLTAKSWVPLPLAETYAAAFAGSPPYLRDLLGAP